MSDKIHKIITIPEDGTDQRLDQALAKLLPDYSRTQIQDWIQNGMALLDGQVVKPNTRIMGGETVSLDAVLKPQPLWEAERIPLSIVYEDDALLVINKPSNLVVHPGTGNPNKTLLNALLHHAPGLQALPRAGILHRLDKNTTGLLVVAKTAAALKDLTAQLKSRTLLREYQAVIAGVLISGGMVDAPIGRHHLQRKRMAVTDTGKEAITHYRVLEKYRAHTRIKIKLETGRTHQIRVHMAHIRHPILGDPTYGGRLQLPKGASTELIQVLRQFNRQALHAFALGLTHPVTQEFMRWEAPLPNDMKALITVLRNDHKSK
mgnify:CR=1 FL=1